MSSRCAPSGAGHHPQVHEGQGEADAVRELAGQRRRQVRAQVEVALHEHEGARAQLQKLYERARNDGERRAALFAVTASFVFEGKMEEALQNDQGRYDIAAKTNDSAAMAGDLNAMGNILMEMGKVDEAKAKYDESIQIIRASNLAPEVKA